MNRDARVFAAELRADALALRIMAESLDLRAAEQDRLAEVAQMEREAAAGPSLAAGGLVAGRTYTIGERSSDDPIPVRLDAEDRHDFRGIGFIGPSHAPEAVFR